MLQARHIPLAATRRFSPLVLDYLAGKERLRPLYNYSPEADGIAEAIEARKAYPVDRNTLADVLYEQYRHLPREEAVEEAIVALREETTFTVCTAHQPNLATGYLYFVYKILHAIKLADELGKAHPQHRFVPVYYMGSEDADLEELGAFRFGDKKFVWEAGGQSGAVGRMNTDSLAPLLQELFALFGPPGPAAAELERLLRSAYLKHDTISAATHYLVHALFGKHGLLVLNPDDARLKRSFIPVMEADLFSHPAEELVAVAIQQMEAAGYKGQAHPRAINLFYLKAHLRERIERQGERWQVLNTDISWSETALREELAAHPERFSPNVVLRPLYQETFLPNVAFIGGGAEVAYWLQLRSLFERHKVFYPAILLRQSVMWVQAAEWRLIQSAGLDYETLALPKDDAERACIMAQSGNEWQVVSERDALEVMLSGLREKAAALDPTLLRSADATLAKMKRQLATLEAKMLRAVKRKETDALDRLHRLQDALFPSGGLAERVENFMPYYLAQGPAFFETLLRFMAPFESSFLIIEKASPETNSKASLAGEENILL